MSAWMLSWITEDAELFSQCCRWNLGGLRERIILRNADDKPLMHHGLHGYSIPAYRKGDKSSVKRSLREALK